ncbi:metallophosphoesterase family protein, partial [Undibacterium luofuense]
MLLALMTDLHANREALEACLAHAQQQGVSQYAFLGDLVGYGADPGWVVQTVM